MKNQHELKLREMCLALGNDRATAAFNHCKAYFDRFKEEKKIAIVGTASKSLREVPYEHEVQRGGNWEIWALSERPDTVELFSRWYEFHNIERKKGKSAAYFEHMKALGSKMWIGEAHPELPEANVFPRQEVQAVFGSYFTNTISWLIAHAFIEGATTIGIWGVDMAQDTEYGRQRPSCEYFIGRCEAAGIQVIIPAESDLLKSRRLYGFDDVGDRMSRAYAQRKADLEKRKAIAQQQHEAQMAQVQQLMGASQEVSFLASKDGELNADLLQARAEELRKMVQESGSKERELFASVHVAEGCLLQIGWESQSV